MAELKVYGAPWCPDCKRSKKFLAEHRIPMQWIDIDQDRDGLAIVQRIQQGGRSIPTIVFPDGSHLIEPSNDELARKLGVRLEASREFYELVIVGGGPAGLAAAVYAAREGISTVVVEKSGFGGQAGATKRIENYPGFPEGIDGAELAERFIAQAKRYEVELVSGVGVTAIEPEMGNLVIRLGNGQELCAHAVLIATGSRYRQLGVPGEGDLTGAGVHYCATCDGPFYRGADELLVIGGGNSALEEALFLTQFAKKVQIVSHGSELRASALVQADVRRHPQIEIVLDTEIVAFNGAKKLEEVVARHRTSGTEQRWHPAAVFVFVGLNPNTEFLREQVHLDPRGFVTTDVNFRTSMPGVFAAGDVRAGATKQLGGAVGEGIAALLQIRAQLQQQRLVSAPADADLPPVPTRKGDVRAAGLRLLRKLAGGSL
jgi:thioredoxin reductase (NADPH)